MTSQKLRTALLAYLASIIEDIPVVASENFETIELPLIAVRIDEVQKHSRTLSKAEIISLSITFKAHAGDELTEQDIYDVSDEILTSIQSPSALRSSLNIIIEDGVNIDHIQFTGGSTDFDDNTFEVTFQGECVIQRVF